MRPPPLLLALPVLFAPSLAHADVLVLADDGGQLTATDRATWVNRARCGCAAVLTATIDTTGLTSVGSVALVAGKSCVSTDKTISDACRTLWTQQVGSGDSVRETTATAEEIAGTCDKTETTLSLWVLYDAADSGEWTSIAKLDLGVDLRAPVAPEATQVVAGETLAEVAFAAGSDAEENDTLRYQVLCTTAAGGVVKKSPPDAIFDSGLDRCGDGDDTVLSTTYVCAEAETGASSVTVQGLTNGVTYTFSVVAVDAAGNPSARTVVGEATPALEEDFWERYQRSGGLADGTGCTAAGAPGSSGLLLVALLVFARVWRIRA